MFSKTNSGYKILIFGYFLKNIKCPNLKEKMMGMRGRKYERKETAVLQFYAKVQPNPY